MSWLNTPINTHLPAHPHTTSHPPAGAMVFSVWVFFMKRAIIIQHSFLQLCGKLGTVILLRRGNYCTNWTISYFMLRFFFYPLFYLHVWRHLRKAQDGKLMLNPVLAGIELYHTINNQDIYLTITFALPSHIFVVGLKNKEWSRRR